MQPTRQMMTSPNVWLSGGYIIMFVGDQTTKSKFPRGQCCVLDDVSQQFSAVNRSSRAAH